ncbi:MAG TPA: S9 family peptidase [Chthoniobacterales bacterium]|jgi:dipeptidyl aminopeptidase/acylaminoacyl peptidase
MEHADKNMHWKILIAAFAAVGSIHAQTPPASSTTASGKHPFTFEEMMTLKRLSEPVPSPDGKWIVFAAVDVDLEANTKISHLWIVPATGGEARRLNQTPNHEERPRFSPDGKRLIWTSKATDSTQIWMCNFTPESGGLDGQPHQVTNISTGADGAIWSPDGKSIVFLSSVYPDCKDDVCNKQRDDELGKSKVKAKIFTKLLYRHWTSYTEFKRSHLFVIGADATVEAGVSPAPASTSEPERLPLQKNEPRDLTPGDHDVPPFNLGGQDMYAISPDGQELAYTSNIDEVEATSTNNEIFLVPMSGGTSKKISTSPGNDNTPLYSPDGNHIAWRSMARGGFEADKRSLIIYQRRLGQMRNATASWDRSVGSFIWSPDSKTIFFSAEDRGESPIYSLGLEAKQPAEVARLHADDLIFGANSQLFFSRASIAAPSEIWRLDASSKSEPAAVTHINDALLSQIDMQELETFTFKGANNDDVQGFLIKPPGFDPAKKYPLKFLIHGGPQGAWGDQWTYRWNAELFAANGYVVVMINFHGSTGYGQKFTDSISGDWGGKPFVDLMKGLDYVEKTYPFIDKNREAALGASYGGYMANWLLGHTDRFKCIVSHDGLFNTESAYGTTEELWFNEWEFKGPPWKNRELYRKFSPHLFADKFKTPTLVVHGQLDFRLDVSEGFQLFTTLQRLGVPSKMLYFPDEGHWVLKPQNSRLWYKTVNDWVDQWCGAGVTLGSKDKS